MTPIEALKLLLAQVDYTRSACSGFEMVAAVLPVDVLARCQEVIDANPS